MAEETQITILDFQLKDSDIIDRLVRIRKESQALRDANKELAKDYEKNASAINKNEIALKELSREERNLKSISEQTVRANKAKEGSIEQLRAQVSLLNKQYESLSKEERNSAKGQELQKSLKEKRELINQLSKAAANTKDNIGNYPELFGEAAVASDVLNESLQALGNTIEDTGEKIDDTSGKTEKSKGVFSDFFDKLKANPLLLVGGAIVAVGAALFNLFSRTQKAQDLLRKSTAGLGAVLDVLGNKIGTLVDYVISVFEKPSVLIADFQNLLKDLFEKQIANFLSGIQGIGKAFSLLFKGEFVAAVKEAGKAIYNIAPTSAIFDKIGNGVKSLTSELIDAGSAAFDLEGKIINLERANRELEKRIAKLNQEYERQQIIADDATRSFAEREKAAERSRRIAQESAKIQADIARNELSVINQQIALKKQQNAATDDLVEKQKEAALKLIEVEGQYQQVLLNNEKQRRELVQDRLERDLDILIDGFDNQKTINERILADEEQTLAKRRAIYNETVELAQKSFDEQIKTIQQFTGKAVDATDLLATADAKALNEKIRGLGLSEIIEGRLLEVIRERRIAVQDLIDDEKTLREAEAKFFFEVQGQEDTRLAQFFAKRRALRAEDLAEGRKLEGDAAEQQLADDLLYYQSKLELNSKFQEEILQNTKLTEKEKQDAIKAIEEENVQLREQSANKQLEIARSNAEKQKRILEATFSATKGFVDGVGSLFQLLASSQEEATELQKIATLAQLAIDTAKSISALTASATQVAAAVAAASGPAGVATGPAAYAAYYATNIAAILANIAQAKQLIAGFELGGVVDPRGSGVTLGGKRHSQGGTKILIEGQGMIEAEKGEVLTIVKRTDSAKLSQLSNLNVSRGGVSFMEQGGITSINQAITANAGSRLTGSFSFDYNEFAKAVSKKPTIVQVSEINKKQKDVNRVQVRGSIRPSNKD